MRRSLPGCKWIFYECGRRREPIRKEGLCLCLPIRRFYSRLQQRLARASGEFFFGNRKTCTFYHVSGKDACLPKRSRKKQKRDEVNNININMGARNESRVFRQILFGNRARKNRLFVFLFRIITTFRERIKKNRKKQQHSAKKKHAVIMLAALLYALEKKKYESTYLAFCGLIACTRFKVHLIYENDYDIIVFYKKRTSVLSLFLGRAECVYFGFPSGRKQKKCVAAITEMPEIQRYAEDYSET